jgi:hypothetical protein
MGKDYLIGSQLVELLILTDGKINLLEIYYSLSVQHDTGTVENCMFTIWVTFFHKLSTNEVHYHELSKKVDSWCGSKWSRSDNKRIFFPLVSVIISSYAKI